MRIVFFNDPHYSSHPPECRSKSYPLEILDKIHDVARIAAKVGAKAIGCSGDWFHRKGKVTFSEANDILAILRVLREKGFDVIGILGNHDIAGHSLDSLDNRAVGTLVHSRVLQLLDHQPYAHADEDGGVYVTGTSYFHGCDADDTARLRMYSAEPPPLALTGYTWVHVAHGTLVKRDFFEDYTRMEDLVELLDAHDRCPDVIVCGHLHYSEGVNVFERPSDGKPVAICRVGSLGRVSSDDLDRQPQALVLATKNGRYVCKPVSVGKEPQRAAPTVDGSDTPDDHQERIEEFVRVLREEADTWSVVDHSVLLRRLAEEMEQPEEVLQVAIQAVERRQ